MSKLAIKNLLVPLPPLPEQSELVGAIVDALEPLSASVNRVNQEISLILEYRERLIADVVTGKLDVRNIEFAAPAEALDEEEPDEPEDEGAEELAGVAD